MRLDLENMRSNKARDSLVVANNHSKRPSQVSLKGLLQPLKKAPSNA